MVSKGNTGAQIEKQLNWQPRFCQFPAKTKTSTLKPRTISHFIIMKSQQPALNNFQFILFKKFHLNYSRKITFFNGFLLSYKESKIDGEKLWMIQWKKPVARDSSIEKFSSPFLKLHLPLGSRCHVLQQVYHKFNWGNMFLATQENGPGWHTPCLLKCIILPHWSVNSLEHH